MSKSSYIYPTELKKLKACTDCHLVKTINQFQKEGCDNCHFRKSELAEKLTSKFKGIIAITDPKRSWAAKYLGKSKKNINFNNYILDAYKPGFYCLSMYEDDNYKGEDYENDVDVEEE